MAAISGAFMSPADERFVGFGERFDSVNQRGRSVEMWAEDRRVANYGPSTYAPIPMLLSSRGHGFALERFERSRFDLAARSPIAGRGSRTRRRPASWSPTDRR